MDCTLAELVLKLEQSSHHHEEAEVECTFICFITLLMIRVVEYTISSYIYTIRSVAPILKQTEDNQPITFTLFH